MIKTSKFSALLMGLLFVLTASFVAEAKEMQTAQLKTSATCGHCKKTIEQAVNQLDGIQSAELNLEDKVITVKYDADKVDAAKIRGAITKAGYDADDVKAVKTSDKRKAGCAKKPSCDKVEKEECK